MTRLLTDAPRRWGSIAARPVSAEALAPSRRHLWEALSDRPEAWAAELSDPADRDLVVIDAAPRSQFAALLDALNAGRDLPHGAAAIALTGDRFKGQRDRTWVARDGNLHLCVYYRSDGPVSRLGAGCTMLPAVAVFDAIRAVCGPRADAGIKWVNDVLVDGCKVAGVLTGTQTRGESMEHVVFGVGVNIAVAPALPSPGFGPPPGCLRDLAGLPDLAVEHLLFPLLDRIDAWFLRLMQDGPGPLLEAYRSRSCVVGREVEIWHDGGVTPAVGDPWGVLLAAGRVETIEPDLGLRIAGFPEPLRKGRLRFSAP